MTKRAQGLKMWKDSARIAMAASHWVTAVLLMVIASTDASRLILAGWSVLAALGGCVFVGWQLLSVERTRVATIAQLLEERSRNGEPQGLHPVRPR